MNFAQICVMLVLWIIIVFITMILDDLLIKDGTIGWIFSAFGFAVCLTILFIDYGII